MTVRYYSTTNILVVSYCFFINTAVEIFFTEDDFRANEASFVPVIVSKDSQVATPIVLDVIPLTVDEAMGREPLLLPENIPSDNPFSPPFASKKIRYKTQ